MRDDTLEGKISLSPLKDKQDGSAGPPGQVLPCLPHHTSQVLTPRPHPPTHLPGARPGRCAPEDSSDGEVLLWRCVSNLLTQRSHNHFSSVAQSCLTLCDPMNRSTPGLPVHHQLLESTQTHVHWVGDAIQPSHPLSSPSPPVHTILCAYLWCQLLLGFYEGPSFLISTCFLVNKPHSWVKYAFQIPQNSS